MSDAADVLIDHAWLDNQRGEVMLVDTRPAKEYWAGHLRGARHLDPAAATSFDSSPAGIAALGEQARWIFSVLGIGADDVVIFYDNHTDVRAARAAWLLHYVGHDAVHVLDGGLAALDAPDLTTEASPVVARQVTGAPRSDIIADANYIRDHLDRDGVQILDVRRATEFYGEEVRAKRAGAIPHALHRDYIANNDAAGKVRPADELAAAFAQIGLKRDREIIVYCGGGARAAHAYFALRRAGFPQVRNYYGSWSEWGNRDDLPVQVFNRPE
jgi:thiosulfate/3-mercaptopyruvate sulfurtransferase